MPRLIIPVQPATTIPRSSSNQPRCLVIPHTYLEHSLSVLRTRLKTPASLRQANPLPEHFPFITISRETGAGTTSLGQQLVPLLNQEIDCDSQGWVFLDKDLLTQALRHERVGSLSAGSSPASSRAAIS